jgi:hypothetical protein
VDSANQRSLRRGRLDQRLDLRESDLELRRQVLCKIGTETPKALAMIDIEVPAERMTSTMRG